LVSRGRQQVQYSWMARIPAWRSCSHGQQRVQDAGTTAPRDPLVALLVVPASFHSFMPSIGGRLVGAGRGR
jgi:hypothetical protein